jgi:hypothetical protein
LFGSLCVSVHTLLHRMPPLKQAHVPLWHVVPPVHTVPHPPQFALSVCSFTHEAPHGDSPPVHVSAHMPETHCWLPEHCVPQPPQLSGSVCSSTHAPLHADSPVGHAQAPPVQLSPFAQPMPHWPQSLESVCRSTHALLQLVRPVPQFVVQEPAEHT